MTKVTLSLTCNNPAYKDVMLKVSSEIANVVRTNLSEVPFGRENFYYEFFLEEGEGKDE